MTFGPTGGTTIAIAACAGLMTYAGGRIGLRLGANMTLVLGITAGVVLGIALFDLLPTAFELGAGLCPPRTLLAALAAGMMLYMIADRMLEAGVIHGGGLRAHLGPASLTLHSLMDGVGMGMAFNVSVGAGIAVAVAVLAHDIADGINTIGLSLAAGRRDIAHRWLVANSAAPLLGVMIGGMLPLAGAAPALFLAGFAGALLYIGACEVLPRSRATRYPLRAALATICGLLSAYAVGRLA